MRVHLFDDEARTAAWMLQPRRSRTTGFHPRAAMWRCTHVRASRRREQPQRHHRRLLKAQYRVQGVVDYSGLEMNNVFLKGTGAMVLNA